MNIYTFSEARKYFEVADAFDDSNEIHTDGTLEDLLNIRIRRHGPESVQFSNCLLNIHSSARGNISMHIGGSDAYMEIGANTRLNVDIRMWRNPILKIYDHTTINESRLVLDNSEITIGRDCMFSDGVLLQSADQHGLVDIDSMQFINSHRRHITIGDHVWLGRRSTVMPDVMIGSGSVLGSGAIATKSAGKFCYLVGIPARPVRERASWTRNPTRANQRETAFFEGSSIEEIGSSEESE